MNFFKRDDFLSMPLPCFLQDLVQQWIRCSGCITVWLCCHLLKTPEEGSEWQWAVVWPCRAQWLGHCHLALYYLFAIHFSCGSRCINSHFYLPSVSTNTLSFFYIRKYLKHCLTDRNSCVCDPWVIFWLSGVVFNIILGFPSVSYIKINILVVLLINLLLVF